MCLTLLPHRDGRCRYFLACAGIHASVAGGVRPSCVPCRQSSWSSQLVHVASGSPRLWSGGAPWASPLLLAIEHKACRGQAALALATSVILLILSDPKPFARHDNWLCIGPRCTTAACHHGGGLLLGRAVGFSCQLAHATRQSTPHALGFATYWRLHSALCLLHFALDGWLHRYWLLLPEAPPLSRSFHLFHIAS